MIKKFIYPERYLGTAEKSPYFEGWYYRFIDRNGFSIAVIPGIILCKNNTSSMSFIQILCGKNHESSWQSFPSGSFRNNNGEMSFSIGNSSFTRRKIILDTETAKGEIEIGNLVSPGRHPVLGNAMSVFRIFPFLQCYYHIINLRSTINGSIFLNNNKYDFSNSTGYLEKNWGKRFPDSWVWMQAHGTSESFVFAAADVPLGILRFTGFVAFLHHKGSIYKFSNYQFGKITCFGETEEKIRIILENRKYRLVLEIRKGHKGNLKSPGINRMSIPVFESLDSSIEAALYKKKGSMILKFSIPALALELSGNYMSLFTKA